MNSTDHQRCGVEDEAGPSELASADTNANLTSQNQSNSECKGAIPKTKPAVKIKTNSTKKSCKFNNNVDEISILTSAVENDVLQVNGVALNTYFTSSKKDFTSSIVTTEGHTMNELTSNSADMHNSLVSLSTEAYNGKNKELKLEYFHLSDDDDDDDEQLSISDDGCIYTYKGDQDADLPVSFFSLDMPTESPNSINRRQSCSPEMDFLEMDFDPGPSSEFECDSATNSEIETKRFPTIKHNDYIIKASPEISINKYKNSEACSASTSIEKTNLIVERKKTYTEISLGKGGSSNGQVFQEIQNKEMHTNMPWTCNVSDRTVTSPNSRLTRKYHCIKGELVSPTDTSQKNGITCNTIVCDNCCVDCCIVDGVESSEANAMIWTEQEAYLKQITQIGPSACGATAVLNVLNALKMPIPSIEKINGCINTRLRSNSGPLTQYLLSRSIAGTTHHDIINCLHKITDGQVYARFFHMYPERVVNLRSWLAFWINKGAVPVATLNLQKCTSGTIPDAWHHQMVFGVSSKGILLCNPVECVAPELLWSQLCSESILLVRREDVLSRWNIKIDLPELMNIKSCKWRSVNVVGQVANLIFESRRELRLGFKNTSHIKIPASYSSGITLAIPVSSNSYSLLKNCPELPILIVKNSSTVEKQ